MRYNIDEILNENKETIINNTIDYTSQYFDGVCQIDVDTGKLFYCGLSTGETENPLNRVVEVYRIPQGFDEEDCCGCFYCDDYGSCNEDKVRDCTVDTLLEEFNTEFDDILSGVLCQIQEWGYDME